MSNLQKVSWLLFSFKGRTSRKQFWLSFLMMIGVSALLVGAFIGYLIVTEADTESPDFYSTSYVMSVLYFVFLLTIPNAIYTKRLHDHGGPGYFSILFFYGPHVIQKVADNYFSDSATYWPLTIIGIVGFLTGIWLCGFREGEPEENEYGITGDPNAGTVQTSVPA